MTTTLQSPDTIQVLDHLLVLCADGVDGYRHAAAAVAEPHIHRVLAKGAADRDAIACVLTNTLVSLGYKPSHHGSIPGAIHRRWVDAIGALKSQPALAVLHECQRGERETIAGFTSALGRSLPDDVHALVQSQLGRVLETSAAVQHLVVDLEHEKPSASNHDPKTGS